MCFACDLAYVWFWEAKVSSSWRVSHLEWVGRRDVLSMGPGVFEIWDCDGIVIPRVFLFLLQSFKFATFFESFLCNWFGRYDDSLILSFLSSREHSKLLHLETWYRQGMEIYNGEQIWRWNFQLLWAIDGRRVQDIYRLFDCWEFVVYTNIDNPCKCITYNS